MVSGFHFFLDETDLNPVSVKVNGNELKNEELIAQKPGKTHDDALADFYNNASRQEINFKASRIRMIPGKFKKVVWDKNIHFSKWKQHLLKILLKIMQTRGQVFFQDGEYDASKADETKIEDFSPNSHAARFPISKNPNFSRYYRR